ncbi:GYDIA family GHMP kinase [Maribacter halichondriae]|uniref:GYDIA family GHMP kinase n=1 Tax=Maribacter halichondriae TaxID=2980554 RepID=UPI0023589A91|nr:GYDIA family GHMP kinase [Maribacter sp. Hal144]
MTQEFYSNGKLLVSGEYAILDGAQGWAVPTKFGQYLRVTKKTSQNLFWKSLDHKGKIWFEGIYKTEPLEEVESSHPDTSKMLLKILSEAQRLNTDFLHSTQGYEIETELTFPKDWGLGSSSTLINTIAEWADVNAFELLAATFGGSGYDIACAQHDHAILYKLKNKRPAVEEIVFNPHFKDRLYFIYLNKKQNSREGIAAYRQRKIDKNALIEQITEITQEMVSSTALDDFNRLLALHEKTLSEVLGIPTVQERLFSDYFGKVKSLGAWGGDFVLATGNENTTDYFMKKGYETIIPYSEMVLA